MKRKNVLKVIGLVLFIVLAVYLTRYGPLSDLSRESIRTMVDNFGILSPIFYIFLYALGICLLLPGTLLTAGGAVAFGTFWGTIYTLIGATIGASGAFFIARWLGKDFVDSLLEKKLESVEKYDEFLKENGFATIFYLRLIFFPFNLLNFGAGLTRVKFSEYFWGTFLGIIPGTFIFTFFFDSISGISSWSDLLSTEVIISVVLFAVAFTVPIIVRRYKDKFLPPSY